MSADIHRVPDIQNEAHASAIEYAESLLERVRDGKVVSITAVEEDSRGYYVVRNSLVQERRKLIGNLMEMIFEMAK